MRLSSLAIVLGAFTAGVYGYASVFAPLGGSGGGSVGSPWPTLNDQHRIIQARDAVASRPDLPAEPDPVGETRGLVPLPVRAERAAPARMHLVVEAPGLKGIVPPPLPKATAVAATGWTPLPAGSKTVTAKIVERPLVVAALSSQDRRTVRDAKLTAASKIAAIDAAGSRVVTGSLGPPMPPDMRALPRGTDFSLRSLLGGPVREAERGAERTVRHPDTGRKIAALPPPPSTVAARDRNPGGAGSGEASFALPVENPFRLSRLGQFSRVVAAVDPMSLGDGLQGVRTKTRPGRMAVPPRGVRTEAEAKEKLRLASQRRIAAVRAQKARQRRASVSRRAAVRREAQVRRARAVRRRAARIRDYREFQAYRNRAIAAQIRRQRYIHLGYY